MKFLLTIVVGLVVSLMIGQTVLAVRALRYTLEDKSSDFIVVGQAPKNSSAACSIHNSCFCQLNFSPILSSYVDNRGFDWGDYFGVFKLSAVGKPLYEIGLFDAGGVYSKYGAKIDQISIVGCSNIVEYQDTRELAKDQIIRPTLRCEFIVARGNACCCTTNSDGSVDCEVVEKTKTGESCSLPTCSDGTAAKEATEANCSTYETPATPGPKSTVEALTPEELKKIKYAGALNKLNLTGIEGVNKFIGRIIGFLMFIIGSLLLLFYVYAGFLWMTSNGNSEQITKAKTIILWATLSIVVQFSAYWLVKNLFGLFV